METAETSRKRTVAEVISVQSECHGTPCPWCILKAGHGDMRGARLKFARLQGELTAESPPEAGAILEDAWRWCQKIDEAFSIDVSGEAVANEMGDAGISTATDASASSLPAPPPPAGPQRSAAPTLPPAPPGLVPEACAPATLCPQISSTSRPHTVPNQGGVPVPGQLDAHWVFECWTGPSLRWVAYPESDQENLRAAYNSGGGVQVVMVNEVRMEVSTTPDDMWQNNPNTEAKPRRVRLSPKGGWAS